MHFGRHHGHELNIGVERQGGHVDDRARDVLDAHAPLALDAAGGIEASASTSAVASSLFGCLAEGDAGCRRVSLPCLGPVGGKKNSRYDAIILG